MVDKAQTYVRSQRSQAMTEFALIGPLLLLIILLIVDFGRGIYYFVTIDNAANEGARVAVRSSAQPTGAGASTLPTDAAVVAAIQNRTAVVFLSQMCPTGPIDYSAAGRPPANVGLIYITEVPAPTSFQNPQPPNAPGGQPLVPATAGCDAIVPVGTPLPGSTIQTPNVPLQVTIRYNFVPITPMIQQLANTINVPLVLQAYAIYRTEY